ncbi:MAG: hypothetical protein SO175_05785 [[Clostridium] scindens]|nr:hypothetical protein [[Clostridium] scindens]
MKIIFNDGTELQIQQAQVVEGALRIKTISATQDQLREMFSDVVKTKKITVEERGQIIGEPYENYTRSEGITVYNAGILEPFLYKEGETPAERMDAAEAAVMRTQSDMQMAVAELTMVIAALTGGMGGDGNV